MHPRRRRSIVVLTAVAAATVGIVKWGPFLWARSQVPMSFHEADLNHDGAVSFTEAAYIVSSGTRRLFHNGRRCSELFAYKDGLPLKVVCP